ncbi:MAG: histidinol phosphate phosphatase, partial [Gammaproteobacteria bacterium]|nr:histidinol phosphate phosphatase [Gammaproteobacteria bacterium]
LDERWIGIQGKPTLFNDRECKVSNVQQLEQAKLYSTEPDMFTGLQLECFDQLTRKVQLRRFGGDCYSYGLLASGHIDLVVDGCLQYYDISALVPVIQGAGGFITDWQGNPLSKNLDGLVVAAATKELHRAALEILSNA